MKVTRVGANAKTIMIGDLMDTNNVTYKTTEFDCSSFIDIYDDEIRRMFNSACSYAIKSILGLLYFLGLVIGFTVLIVI